MEPLATFNSYVGIVTELLLLDFQLDFKCMLLTQSNKQKMIKPTRTHTALKLPAEFHSLILFIKLRAQKMLLQNDKLSQIITFASLCTMAIIHWICCS